MGIVQDMTEIAEVFASKKRLLVLHFLKDEPLGYTQIEKSFKKTEVKGRSSEVYKHLRVLLKHEYIVKREGKYLITSKGIKALVLIDELTKEKAKIPKVKLDFV